MEYDDGMASRIDGGAALNGCGTRRVIGWVSTASIDNRVASSTSAAGAASFARATIGAPTLQTSRSNSCRTTRACAWRS